MLIYLYCQKCHWFGVKIWHISTQANIIQLLQRIGWGTLWEGSSEYGYMCMKQPSKDLERNQERFL